MTRSRPAARSPEGRFRAFYAGTYADVLRFVVRRVPAYRAEDVTAEVFLVAWRRVDELPRTDDDARAWVFGVARNVLLNDERGERRRRALAVRLAATAPPAPDDDPELVARRIDLAAVWPRLTAVDQEVLALAYWEDLTGPQAAHVLDISPVAYRLRLTRARRALRRHLELCSRAPAAPRSTFPEGSTP